MKTEYIYVLLHSRADFSFERKRNKELPLGSFAILIYNARKKKTTSALTRRSFPFICTLFIETETGRTKRNSQ
ncbi:hypothetical protein PUN28_003110 [Cardiocondyla obscurior]|uniref:Uncharacterized protein n=1 Tax=Cardiocondyla obscurior TaxID=286306 RepID=A0AAW2GN09_9HYME